MSTLVEKKINNNKISDKTLIWTPTSIGLLTNIGLLSQILFHFQAKTLKATLIATLIVFKVKPSKH